MVSSTATTVADYLAELSGDRSRLIEAVRRVINDNLPAGYKEVMNWGMITWEVPLATWPDTYNGKPLMFASLASQKNYCALYLLCSYWSEDMRQRLLEWEVPLATWPDTHNGKPLMFASLASQKNYCALYLMCSYWSEDMRQRLLGGYRAIGVKPNMGKSCLRFTRLDQLPLETIGEITAASPVDSFLDSYRRARG